MKSLLISGFIGGALAATLNDYSRDTMDVDELAGRYAERLNMRNATFQNSFKRIEAGADLLRCGTELGIGDLLETENGRTYFKPRAREEAEAVSSFASFIMNFYGKGRRDHLLIIRNGISSVHPAELSAMICGVSPYNIKGAAKNHFNEFLSEYFQRKNPEEKLEFVSVLSAHVKMGCLAQILGMLSPHIEGLKGISAGEDGSVTVDAAANLRMAFALLAQAKAEVLTLDGVLIKTVQELEGLERLLSTLPIRSLSMKNVNASVKRDAKRPQATSPWIRMRNLERLFVDIDFTSRNNQELFANVVSCSLRLVELHVSCNKDNCKISNVLQRMNGFPRLMNMSLGNFVVEAGDQHSFSRVLRTSTMLTLQTLELTGITLKNAQDSVENDENITQFLQAIGVLKNLKTLRIVGLSGLNMGYAYDLFQSISKIKSLYILRFEDVDLDGNLTMDIVDNFASIDQLRALELSGTNLKDVNLLFMIISSLPNLRRLDLSENGISGTLPEAIVSTLMQMENLKELNMLGNDSPALRRDRNFISLVQRIERRNRGVAKF